MLRITSLGNPQKIFLNAQTFIVIVLYCTKRRCSQKILQLKVQIKYGRKSP